MLNDGYFSGMSLGDWIGIALFAPLLLALTLLLVYVVIGILGSGPRRRRIANQPPDEREPSGDAKPAATRRQAPGD